jgi:hypothetical protein
MEPSETTTRAKGVCGRDGDRVAIASRLERPSRAYKKGGTILLVVGLALLLLLTVSCEAEMAIEINGDESGTAVITVLIDKSLASSIDESQLDDLTQELPDAKIETITRGDMKGFVVTQGFEDLDGLVALLGSAGAGAGQGDTGLQNTTQAEVTRKGDAARLTIREAADAASLSMIQVRYVITLPSKPLAHNAQKVKGNTLTWELQAGENEMFAEWKSAGASGSQGSEDEGAAGGTSGSQGGQDEGSAAGATDDRSGNAAKSGGDSDDGSSWVLPLAAGLGGALGLAVLAAVAYYAFLRRRGVPAAQGTQRFCMHCGAPLSPGARFCLKCGRPTD